MDKQYFVVLQNLDSKHKPVTLYPEVHYIFEDDELAPEIDALDRQDGDISVIVNLDETGLNITNCQSISPDWQVLNATLDHQNLDASRKPPTLTPTTHNSNLLRIRGITPQYSVDRNEYEEGNDFESQAAYCSNLIEQIKLRQEELDTAVASYSQKADVH